MYDVIVIGDDLSSHVAAATACRHGLKTLLIAETGTGGLKVLDDFVFNIDPVPATGLGADQPAGKILTELGIPLPEGCSEPLNPAYQIILPNHRLDFFSEPSGLAGEMVKGVSAPERCNYRIFKRCKRSGGHFYRLVGQTPAAGAADD